jgi:urea transport system ATP-binding protein
MVDPQLSKTWTSPTILSVDALSVSFDGFKAVDIASFYVDRNEVRVLIGPNGAGKTTLLDLVSGKTKRTTGTITFLNTDISGMAEQKIVRLGVGRKFQTPSIYPDLTVFENLEVSHPEGRSVVGSLFFRRRSDILDSIHETAALIKLRDRLHHKAGLLSHGQKQWLEIGMLLIADHQLIMLDEPVAGMSVKEREETAELLDTICTGRSVLVVEHDMNFVRRIAHRVTVLHQGKILAEGSMDEVENDQRVIDVYIGH